jgi:hypothetical protein
MYHRASFLKTEPRKIGGWLALEQQTAGTGTERDFKKRASSSHVSGSVTV